MQLAELEAKIEQMRTYPCYLLLALPRTGNTAVWTALNAHPQMHWSGEIWSVASQNKRDHGKTCGQRLAQSWGSPCGGSATTHIIERLDEPLRPEHWKVLIPQLEAHQRGFGVKQLQLSTFFWPIVNRLQDHLKVIKLGRRNEIARYVSGHQAAQTGLWHLWKGKHKRNRQLRNAPAVHIDVEALEQHIVWRRAQWAGYNEAFPDGLEMYHEDLVADPQAFFQRICEYLEVAAWPLESQVRANPTPWQARVLNYQEIRDNFRGRPEFDHCFDKEP